MTGTKDTTYNLTVTRDWRGHYEYRITTEDARGEVASGTNIRLSAVLNAFRKIVQKGGTT